MVIIKYASEQISSLVRSSCVGMSADKGANPHSILGTLSILKEDSKYTFEQLSFKVYYTRS